LLSEPGGKVVFTGHRSLPGLMHGSGAAFAAAAQSRQKLKRAIFPFAFMRNPFCFSGKS